MRQNLTKELALTEAVRMLKVVERGGSYNAADWYDRMLKIEACITTPGEREYLIETVKFDLHATKVKGKQHQ